MAVKIKCPECGCEDTHEEEGLVVTCNGGHLIECERCDVSFYVEFVIHRVVKQSPNWLEKWAERQNNKD